jgi:cytidine deaminase
MNLCKEFDKLRQAAEKIRDKAYAPYSGFAVGAAVEGESGAIYSGCNIENASYGLTVCAERTAIAQAVTAGERKLKRLLVVADTESPIAPCGACRQVMVEFGIDEVILCNIRGESRTVLLKELLPQAFGPENLKGAAGS